MTKLVITFNVQFSYKQCEMTNRLLNLAKELIRSARWQIVFINEIFNCVISTPIHQFCGESGEKSSCTELEKRKFNKKFKSLMEFLK